MGVRILVNQIIPITDWNHEFVTVISGLETASPLPTLTSFDLLNPLDNSNHGYQVTRNGGQVRAWGLHYDNGAIPSATDFMIAGHGAVSFLTAFRLSSLSRYTNIFSNRSAGAGFNFYQRNGLYMSYTFPSGTDSEISAGGVITPLVDTWYVAAGVFDPAGATASVRIDGLGLQYGGISNAFPQNTVLNNPLSIGGHPSGSTASSMMGDLAFLAVYDGAFTATQRDEMVNVGRGILQGRGLI